MPVRGDECRDDERVIRSWRVEGAAQDAGTPLVLALHGMGMDPDSFAVRLQALFDLPVRLVLPHAPLQAPRGGGSWYDYDGDTERFRAELQRTETLLLAFLESLEAREGWSPRARVVLGFSQGGYCGAYVALRNAQRFGGMVISGARVKIEVLENEIREAARSGFEALLCHGRRDQAVKPEAAESSARGLRAGGVRVTLQHFDSGHALGRTQVPAIRAWLVAHLDLPRRV